MKEKKTKLLRQMTLLLVMTGIAMMLSACGQKETMSSGAEIQEISDAEDGDNALTGDATGNDSMTAQTTTDGSSMTEEHVDSAAQTFATGEDAAGQQLEMDEETRKQLTAELLQENGLDTSVVETERSTRECTFDIPEGFEESEEVENLYVTSRYPLDTSMIYYEVMDGDDSLQLMTEDMFREQAEESLHRAYGEDIEIIIDSYEIVKISGYPAFRILCHYKADNIKATQLEYIINADKTYAVTYSQTNEIDWMEAFEASAATIRVR